MCVQDRIRLAYRTSLGYFYRFPEVWQEFAEYELDTGNTPLLRMITSNTLTFMCQFNRLEHARRV